MQLVHGKTILMVICFHVTFPLEATEVEPWDLPVPSEYVVVNGANKASTSGKTNEQ